ASAKPGLVKRANDVLQQKVSKWIEDTGRKDWSRAVPLCCYAMNIQTSRQTKNSPYALQKVVEFPLGAAALNIEEQQLLEHELKNERLNEITDNEELDDMINERLNEIVDDEVLDNIVNKKLDEQLNERINKQSDERLSISDEENALNELSEDEGISRSLPNDEVISRSLPEDGVVYRSLPEDRTAGRRLPENFSDIRPNKRHKPSVLTATTMCTNTQLIAYYLILYMA
ncbi:10129_t:CDS:2, partial [Gigaspora rosea]